MYNGFKTQAEYDLWDANQHNAYRAMPGGEAISAYTPSGQSTGGVNAVNQTSPWQQNLGLTSAVPAAVGVGAAGGAAAQQPAQQAQSNLGLGGYDSYTPNPYLKQMAEGIGQQATDNFTRNIAPSLRSGAMAAGGFGGSRQGVVEANALKDLNNGVTNAVTNLYGTDYNNAMNRNFNYAQLDSSNAQFGANYGLNALNAQNQWANNGVNAANQMQNAPIDYNRYFTNNATQIAGQGGSATQTNQGNPYLGAAGGALLGSKLYGLF